MYETNAPAELVTPSFTIQFNVDLGGGAMYFFDKVSGLDGVPRRAVTEDRSVADGEIWHDYYKKGRRPVYEGTVLVAPDTAWNQVVQRNQMCQDLEDALDEIAAAKDITGSYSWTNSGMPTRTMDAVRNDIEINFTGKLIKSFTFGLVAANPTLT